MANSTNEKLKRAHRLQENAEFVFKGLMEGDISTEQARTAVELLQLSADLIDLTDGLARKAQVYATNR